MQNIIPPLSVHMTEEDNRKHILMRACVCVCMGVLPRDKTEKTKKVKKKFNRFSRLNSFLPTPIFVRVVWRRNNYFLFPLA